MVPGDKYDAMLGIGNGSAGFVKMRRQFFCPDHIMYAFFQQRPTRSCYLRKNSPDIGHDVSHQRDIRLVHQKRHLARHCIGNPHDAGSHHTVRFASGSGDFSNNYIGINAVDFKLHFVHVLLFDLRYLIVRHRTGFPLFQNRHRLFPHLHADVSFLQLTR